MRRLLLLIIILCSVLASASDIDMYYFSDSDEILVIKEDSPPVFYKTYVIEEKVKEEVHQQVAQFKEHDDSVTITEISKSQDSETKRSKSKSEEIEPITEAISVQEENENVYSKIQSIEEDHINNMNIEGVYNNYFYLSIGEHYDYDCDYSGSGPGVYNHSLAYDALGTFNKILTISTDQYGMQATSVYNRNYDWHTNFPVKTQTSESLSNYTNKVGGYIDYTLENQTIEIYSWYDVQPYNSTYFIHGYKIKNTGAFALTNTQILYQEDIDVQKEWDHGIYYPEDDSIVIGSNNDVWATPVGKVRVYPSVQSDAHSVSNSLDVYFNQTPNMTLDNSNLYNLVDPLDNEENPTTAYYFDVGNLAPGEEFTVYFTFEFGDFTTRPRADLDPSDITFQKQDGSVNVSFNVRNNENQSASNFDVLLYEIKDNAIVKNQTINYQGSIGALETKQFSTLFDISKDSELYLYVDPDYRILESNEGNNVLTQRYYSANLYIDVNVTPNILNDMIKDYIQDKVKSYNIVEDKSLADYVLYVGYNPYNTETLEKGWGLKNGNIKMYANYDSLPYNALVNVYENDVTNIIVQGNAIEGIVAALRQMNYDILDNNKDIYIGKENIDALSTFDYFNYNKEFYLVNNETFRDIAHLGLLGGFSFKQELVKTQDLVSLRLKHIEPQHTYSFKQLLDQLNGDLNLNYTELPVVIARGLWSNLTTWENLGTELASTGRDVWLIEITGGPGQDCETCNDYTFDDLTDSYWPALIAGVEAYTGKDKIQYVGFSNGARTALSALDKWGTSGKSNVGKYWTGSTWSDCSMSPNVVDHLVVAGAPGAFEGSSFGKTLLVDGGEYAIDNLRSQGITHASNAEVILNGLAGLDFFDDSSKISLNLLSNYTNFAKSSIDLQPGQNIIVPKFSAIRGYVTGSDGNDLIVTKEDMDAIYSGVSSASKNYFKVFGDHSGHIKGFPDRPVTIDIIKRRLNNDNLSEFQKCYNLIDPDERPWWCS